MARVMHSAKSALLRAARSPARRSGTAALADFDPRDGAALDTCIERSAGALRAEQRRDGHWVFELEADATIPAEYVLLKRYLGEPDMALEGKIASYLRRTQAEHGGWPLFHDGPFNISASVKAYFALKVIGDAPEAPHMQKARAAILAHGGAGTTNVFTRMLLALHGIIPWQAVPSIPVEIMYLPRWFPFHLFRISYWGRTVLAPLLVLQATKPSSRHPHGVTLDELFPSRSARIRRAPRALHQSRPWFAVFATIDAMLRFTEPYFPSGPRRRAVDRAVAFVTERLNGEDGLGAIFPAMANTVMMFDVLGYPRDHPDVVTALAAIDKLLVERHDEAYCQPCVSPVWDTVLACHALIEVGGDDALASARKGLMWLAPRQVLDTVGDWADQRPGVRPGGWAFQYANPHYPDLDDTAVVVMAMDRGAHRLEISGGADFSEAIDRGREWVLGLQSRNGGWGAFDADNTSEYLNHIPFADHGALHKHAGATGQRRRPRCACRRTRFPAPHAGGQRIVARSLGHELHLRDVVGAVRVQRRRREPAGAANQACREVAGIHEQSRRRMGRARLQLRTRPSRTRAGAQHRVTDGVGAARVDGGWRSRQSGGSPRHRLFAAHQCGDRSLVRASFHCHRFSARVLPALPRLLEVLSAVGARAV